MKTSIIFLLLFAILSTQSVYSQATTNKADLDSGTINEQFDYVIKKSNPYMNFKVVRVAWLNKLKSHVNDSLNKIQSELLLAKQEVLKEKNKVTRLQNELKDTNNELDLLSKKKNGANFFGASLSNSTYRTILWSLIILLFIALILVSVRLKNNHVITKKTLAKYDELEVEYNAARTRSLEREQKLNRKLQDEINKQLKKK